jgi:simple sugar transport system ATP-binding protein
LGEETVKGLSLDMATAREKVVALSEKYNLKIDVDARVADTSVGMQQRVEILKMLYRDNHILIFDEPTAVLTPQEIDELMGIMQNLVAEGKSIIFITHKLEEIKKVACRCTVLRRGKCVGTVDVASTSKEEMSEMMVGRKIDFTLKKNEQHVGEVVLDVQDLRVADKRGKAMDTLKGISFSVRRGEVVSIAGIEGNGQSELAQAIAGLIGIDGGEVTLAGNRFARTSIRYRNTHGLAYIPEDRHRHGLILDSTLEENLALKRYFAKDFQLAKFIRFFHWRQYAEKLIEKFDIRSGQGPKTMVRSMSGGNQQKAIVARELDLDQNLVLAVQPTRGLDVGAIEYIHYQLLEQRDKGKGVLVISFELEEIMDISDRVLVMYEGEIVAELLPKETTVQEIGLYMAGSKRKEA